MARCHIVHDDACGGAVDSDWLAWRWRQGLRGEIGVAGRAAPPEVTELLSCHNDSEDCSVSAR